MRSLFFCVLAVICALLAVTSAESGLPEYIVRPVTLQPANYQKWAHLHWAWLKNDQGNQTNVLDLMKGYQSNKIPLGAINIDSTWATQFNNFDVNKDRFPDFAGLVKELHDNDLKVILWATSMINVENPDYSTAYEKGYLVKDAKGRVPPIEWWHGSGALLDYTNPEAVAWWHSLMDRVLDVGVDGFKCDGTDPYIMEYKLFGGAYGHDGKEITYPEYAHAYYRDFFYYTRQKRSSGKENDAGLIMSRPIDCLMDEVSKVCNPFSPKDVMYSGWVGDDDASFDGMRDCMRKVIYSAWSDYGNYGCDINGYRGNSETDDREVFIRWAQLGAFLPLMENGGGGEHRPWMYDQEVVDIYRRFVVQHHRLASYLHTVGANAVDSGKRSLHPVDDLTLPAAMHKDIHIVFPQPKTYSYQIGDSILVHPVMHNKIESEKDAATLGVDLKQNEAVVHMTFPDSDTETVWLDWWHPNDMRKSYKSGDKALRVVAFDTYPVYVKQGALLPLHLLAVDVQDKSIETVDLSKTTFTWFHPQKTATAANPTIFQMRESITTGTGMQAKAYYTTDDTFVAELSAHADGGGFAFVGVSKPSDVKIDAWVNGLCQDVYDPVHKTLHVGCQNLSGGLRVTVTGAELSLE